MCWTSLRFRPIIAKKNLTVYKLVTVHNDIIKSLFYDFRYIINNANPDIHFVASKVGEWYSISLGYHSYICKPVKYNGYVYTYYNNILNQAVSTNLSNNKSTKLLKCLIPEGARFIINETGNVVSDTIVAKEIIEIEETKDIYKYYIK